VRYGWDDVPVQHHLRVATLAEFLTGHLGVDPRAGMVGEHWPVDSTPVLSSIGTARRLRALYAAPPG
jgi:hypothetical protein